MSNITRMELQESIKALQTKGWSTRRIVRELGLNRRTVARYAADSKCTTPQIGKQGTESLCEAYREEIRKWYEGGLSVERIRRDLWESHGFGARITA